MLRVAAFALVSIFFCTVAYADETVSFASSPLWLSTTRAIEGDSIKVSTVVTKNGTSAVSGSVTFFANDTAIGSSDFSLSAQTGGAIVAVSWVPKAGEYRISAKMTKASIARNGKNENVTTSATIAAQETLRVDAKPEPAKIATTSQSASAQTVSSDFTSRATNIAKSTGNVVFEKTESFRASGDAFIDAELAKDSDTSASGVPGIVAGAKTAALKAASYLFKNIYAFYLVLILFILWLLRKIWKRYSLD